MWHPDDNDLELIVKHCLTPILCKAIKTDKLRSLCDDYGFHYSKRTSKAGMSERIGRLWLKQKDNTTIEYYLYWAEVFYYTRLYGDSSLGIQPDLHKPGTYKGMLERIHKVRHYLETGKYVKVLTDRGISDGSYKGPPERREITIHQIEDRRYKTSFIK